MKRLLCLVVGHRFSGWMQDQELVIRVCERCDNHDRIIVQPFDLACSIEGRSPA